VPALKKAQLRESSPESPGWKRIVRQLVSSLRLKKAAIDYAAAGKTLL